MNGEEGKLCVSERPPIDKAPAPLSMGQPVKSSVEKASKIREGKVRDWDWEEKMKNQT